MVIPVSKKGTEKSMTDCRPELIFIDVNTMSVSWFINSATSPFHFPLTIPPHLPSRTLVIWKSKLRSEANLSKRSTQNPEQHRRIFESSFLASWVIFTPMIWSSCLSWHSTPLLLEQADG